MNELIVRHDDSLDELMRTLEFRKMHPTDVWGYPCGFDRLDKATGGIRFKSDDTPGDSNEMTVVDARSGVGKSAFGMSVSLSVARKFKREYPGLEVRIFLMEMDPAQVQKRLVAQMAGVPIYELSTGRYSSPGAWDRIEKASKKLKGLPIVYRKGAASVDAIGSFVKGRNTRDDRYCGFWMLDHIGLVPTDAGRNSNTSFVLGTVSRSLHELCRSVAPGYVLCQLNRESLKRKDPTPTAADLYGSDRIMQDTDNLLLLHRPKLYTNGGDGEARPATPDDDAEMAQIIVEKQRDGAAGKVIPMNYVPRYAMWADIQEDEVEDEPV